MLGESQLSILLPGKQIEIHESAHDGDYLCIAPIVQTIGPSVGIFR